jgi:predicted RNA-binding protein (virulence factor B family)
MRKEELEHLQSKVKTFTDFRAYIEQEEEFVFYMPLDLKDKFYSKMKFEENIRPMPFSTQPLQPKLIWLACDFFELRKGNIVFKENGITTKIKTKDAQKIIFDEKELEIKIIYYQNKDTFVAPSLDALEEIKKFLAV